MNRPTTIAADTDLAAADLVTFAREQVEDDRMLRRSLVLAGVLHLALLLVHLPRLSEPVLASDAQPKVFVVQQVRFKQPPPRTEREIPQRRPLRVPVPDPTPDEPETIRDVEEQRPELDLPDSDLLFDLPSAPPPVIRDAPIVVGGDVREPRRIFDPRPSYTDPARRARVEGVVIVQAIIDRGGNVTNAKILKGLPFGLDENTLNAVKQWRFEPATLHGRPVSVYYTLTVHFGIN